MAQGTPVLSPASISATPPGSLRTSLRNIGSINRHLIRFISHEQLENITEKHVKLSSVWSGMLDRLPNLDNLKIIIRPAVRNALASQQEYVSLLHRCRSRLDKYGTL